MSLTTRLLGLAFASADALVELDAQGRIAFAIGAGAVSGQDAAAWQLLAQVWRQQGQNLRAIRAEAEAQAAHYDYAAAVDRFKAGQDLARRGQGGSGAGAANDYIEASIIDTRLRAVESLAKEQAAER